jgi:ABC-type uncharacterized transport system fused permease/ATPase subunit
MLIANSSWYWLTDPPLTSLLPFAIIFTLAVETIAIIIFGKATKKIKAFCVVLMANILSFASSFIDPISKQMLLYDYSINLSFDLIEQSVKYSQYYIVAFWYLILTLVVEMPVVYFLLRKDTSYRKRLILSILISNIITTAAVAICERVFYIGVYGA